MKKSREITVLVGLLCLQIIPWTFFAWDACTHKEEVSNFFSSFSLWLGSWWFFAAIILSLLGLVLAAIHAGMQSDISWPLRLLIIVTFVLITPVAISIYSLAMILRKLRLAPA
ncbi:hypothetical protein [Pseudoxanthomonas sacheonensis]|uniref:hypothetical protein n=1 Tax=Pseudoxanthomonas sacheonensis TaxID=443615 RepID=UPI0013D7E9F3|nr:hypothetical protein [Pseudoxanthomonas sacheonensis]